MNGNSKNSPALSLLEIYPYNYPPQGQVRRKPVFDPAALYLCQRPAQQFAMPVRFGNEVCFEVQVAKRRSGG